MPAVQVRGKLGNALGKAKLYRFLNFFLFSSHFLTIYLTFSQLFFFFLLGALLPTQLPVTTLHLSRSSPTASSSLVPELAVSRRSLLVLGVLNRLRSFADPPRSGRPASVTDGCGYDLRSTV